MLAVNCANQFYPRIPVVQTGYTTLTRRFSVTYIRCELLPDKQLCECLLNTHKLAIYCGLQEYVRAIYTWSNIFMYIRSIPTLLMERREAPVNLGQWLMSRVSRCGTLAASNSRELSNNWGIQTYVFNYLSLFDFTLALE